ncbi:hypothetical protein M8R20_11210 [Pseudomonas sp. R2.Fl]|nr:hypothetical protein [Pseudomonas sp. R2.Fl]
MASILTTAGLAALIALPAAPTVPQGQNAAPRVLVQAQGDCRAAAQQVVRETGGQLLSARPSGGTCVVTVLIPAKGNERPRKVTVRINM